jgi:hypothetical protein
VDRAYVRFEDAQDQFIGRMSAMLDVNNVTFDALPPHFDVVDDEIKEAVQACFPRAAECMQSVLTLCLASLVHHHAFFVENLPKEHLLFKTPLFTQRIGERLSGRVALSFEHDVISPTGIPPHVGIQRQVVELAKKVEELPSKVQSVISGELEKRASDAGSITRETLSQILGGMFESLKASLVTVPQPQVAAAVPNNEHPAFLTFAVNGQLRRLPENFEFDTSLPAEVLFQLYCCGDQNTRISPYRLLTSLDCPTQKQRKRLSDVMALMRPVESALKKQGAWKANPTIIEANEMWSAGKGVIAVIAVEGTTAKKRTRRNAQLAWSTQLKEVRKRARHQEEQEDSNADSEEAAAEIV